MTKNGNSEKLQRTDHDLLIRLESKVDQITLDIKEVKDGTKAQLLNLDQRIKAMEELRDKLAPTELHTMILAHEQWIHDFKLTYKVIIGVAITLSSIVTFILSVAFRFACLWGNCV